MNTKILISELRKTNGATFAQLTTETAPVLPGGKSNPYQGRITKKTIQNVQIGTDYEAAVNRKAGKEGNENQGSFKSAGLREGHTWVIPRKLIDKKGSLQLRYTKQNHMSAEVEWFLDGKPVDVSDIKDYLPKPRASRKQKEFGNSEEVRPRDVKLENIRQISINGKVLD